MMDKARHDADPDIKRTFLENGEQAARAWRCPRIAPASTDPLDESHQHALDRVERLTGHRFCTCPQARLRERWVHEAVEAERTGLAEVRTVYGRVPMPLIEATRIVRQARNACEREEQRVALEEINRRRSKT